MPAIIARLLVSVVVVLSGPAVFAILSVLLVPGFGMDQEGIMLSAVLALVLSSLAWWIVWKGEVVWTGARAGKTWGVAGGAIFFGLLAGFVVAAVLRYNEDMMTGTALGCLVAYLVWLGGTPLVWKETLAERGGRLRAGGLAGGVDAVRCPTCGYSMAGLREAKCPECGAAYTLDQLVAAVIEKREEVRG